MSLASLRLHSPWRTLGSAPGIRLLTDNQALNGRVSSVLVSNSIRTDYLANRTCVQPCASDCARPLTSILSPQAGRGRAEYRIRTIEKLVLLRACHAR